MKIDLFISLLWVFCTAFASFLSEHAPKSKARLLSNFKSRILSNRDGLSWTDDFFNTDAITSDVNLASDADTEGFFSDQNPSWSISSGNDINGQSDDDSIPDDSIISLASADPLEDSCSLTSHSSSYPKVRIRNDASCPSPEAAPLSPKASDVPSFPNLMDQIDPQLPIDVPLFNLNHNDDIQCGGPGYTQHLCCDGPRGPWIDRWSHYEFVLNCLPCTVEIFHFSWTHCSCMRKMSFISSSLQNIFHFFRTLHYRMILISHGSHPPSCLRPSVPPSPLSFYNQQTNFNPNHLTAKNSRNLSL